MVRLLLVLTFVALLLGGFFAVGNVHTRIDTLTENLDQADSDLRSTQSELAKAKTAQKDAVDAMKTAQKNKQTAENNLLAAGRELAMQRERADKHKEDLDTTRAELVEAVRTSASWSLFEQANGTKEQISQKLATFTEVNNQRANFLAENTILLSQIEKIGVELSRYTGTSVKVSLPQNLHGTVTAVDAQFDFVVLDIGESQGAREHGELIVSRGEKLIGKLRILDVKKDHSIANIIPNWKQGEIQTGDLVIVGN
ncbi:MAG: hypothetical protein QGH02_01845 [Verrucomicrobiota bacterium]|jgi:uncharacterized phage infection (PIP) family protein YhgE|nr:hypothetical protein [Verrucomicrobiota bacterium]